MAVEPSIGQLRARPQGQRPMTSPQHVKNPGAQAVTGGAAGVHHQNQPASVEQANPPNRPVDPPLFDAISAPDAVAEAAEPDVVTEPNAPEPGADSDVEDPFKIPDHMNRQLEAEDKTARSKTKPPNTAEVTA